MPKLLQLAQLSPAGSSNPLDQLRDIHLPEAIGFWPPAPGWWLLALLTIIAVTLLSQRIIRHKRRQRYRKQALQQLTRLQHYKQQPVEYLQKINTLIKQTAITAQSRLSHGESVSHLSGRRWLQYLDKSSNNNDFTEGLGKLLAEGPYRSNIDDANLDGLEQITRQWIKQHRAVEA